MLITHPRDLTAKERQLQLKAIKAYIKENGVRRVKPAWELTPKESGVAWARIRSGSSKRRWADSGRIH